MSVNLYKVAAEKRLRFPSVRGSLTVEDLFQLPLTSKNGADLDTIARTINAEVKREAEVSFVSKKSVRGAELQVRLEIVKDVISFKLDQEAEAESREANKAKKDKILRILARKEEEELEGLSAEELKALI